MTVTLPFNRDFRCDYGVVEQVSPLIRRIVAENPGPFTFTGTGTYIIGRGEVAIIDPGPAMAAHIDALLGALAGERVTHILVTHTHADHSPAAGAIKRATGALTLGFGGHGGRADDEAAEEGADRTFVPDVRLKDGDVVEGAGWVLEAVHTPGHTANHLCYALREERALFSGDHVMGWSTSVISPPDGNMADYLASLEALLARDDVIYWPTHGAPIAKPRPLVEAFIAHRLDRERQILACLEKGVALIPDLVKEMYLDIPHYLHPAAARSVLAHLICMVDTGRVVCDQSPAPNARFAIPRRG
ncbi:MAG: MBL fold metallo-hydrolase [Sphingomonadales bacterium]